MTCCDWGIPAICRSSSRCEYGYANGARFLGTITTRFCVFDVFSSDTGFSVPTQGIVLRKRLWRVHSVVITEFVVSHRSILSGSHRDRSQLRQFQPLPLRMSSQAFPHRRREEQQCTAGCPLPTHRNHMCRRFQIVRSTTYTFNINTD